METLSNLNNSQWTSLIPNQISKIICLIARLLHIPRIPLTDAQVTHRIIVKNYFKIECRPKGQTYKTAEIILLCHKVLHLFCTVIFTSELIAKRQVWLLDKRIDIISYNIAYSWPRFAYSLYNFHWATMTTKRSLQVCIPLLKPFDAKFSKSRRKLAKNLRFGGNGVKM